MAPIAKPDLFISADWACREDLLEVFLEQGPRAPAVARRLTRDVLAGRPEWDDDRVHEALLVVSELVTNAVVHALPPVVLQLQLDPEPGIALRVHVTDGGPGSVPEAATESDPEEHGRGLPVIGTLTDRSGIRAMDSPGGALVVHWADLGN
ncbi:ATP-binding protein [Streptomyces sp. NPDC002516]